jgi:polysaccharide pyruvyl transferase WcaK-like protein
LLIELHGGQFQNKGASKMVLATIDELRKRFDDVTFVVDPCVGDTKTLDQLGIKQFAVSRGWMGGRLFKIKFLLQRLVDAVARVAPFRSAEVSANIYDVNAFIDISGFAYSDQWGHKPARDSSSLASWYKGRNKKVIYLPQAFGTFTDEKLQRAIKNISGNADLVFARDQISLANLQEMTSSNNLRLSPDITIPTGCDDEQSSLPGEQERFGIVIVPNARLMDKGGMFWSTEYVFFLRAAITACLKNKITVSILLHDNSGEDRLLAEKVLGKISGCALIQIDDPLELKKFISKHSLLIGSRFHALVASLSTGVPTICIGWSHKYYALMTEFSQSDCMIPEGASVEGFVKLILDMNNPQRNAIKSLELKEMANMQAKRLSEMWDEVQESLVES